MDIYIAQYNAISRYSLQQCKLLKKKYCEPEYETVLDPRSMRRLSKILKWDYSLHCWLYGTSRSMVLFVPLL
jgi:hypothetical protein